MSAAAFRKAALILGSLIVLVGIGGMVVTGYLQRDVPEVHADIQEHFKYGSIGSDTDNGVPYWIWRVLPKLFPEYHERFYATFFLDMHGFMLEAFCHKPEEG